jgi:hypothetical protein
VATWPSDVANAFGVKNTDLARTLAQCSLLCMQFKTDCVCCSVVLCARAGLVEVLRTELCSVEQASHRLGF